MNDQYNLIQGKYWSPKGDSHLGLWQVESNRLDHEQFTQQELLPYIGRCKTILDGGAFNGDHTIFYSGIVGKHKDGRVLAVEAGAVAFKALEHNVANFENNNVEIVNGALWNVDGSTLMHTPQTNLGASGVSEGSGTVETFTIDTLCRFYDLVLDFVKLDIEGAEHMALQGAHDTLTNVRPLMLIEVNFARLADFKKTPGDLFDILRKYRYEFRSIQNCAFTEPQYDLLCLPEP